MSHIDTNAKTANRTLLFAGRTAKEILRDPLSFVFCLGLPVVMLAVMYLVFASSAPEQFSLERLTPGIAVFSGAFTMLYMTLLTSRDRATAFLCRLYTSPMRTGDFVWGYALPGLVIGVGQLAVCYLSAVLLGFATAQTGWIDPVGILSAILSALPMLAAYVFVGILFGCLFSDKAAPGFSSIIISAGGFLSGAWAPVELMSEGFRTVCRCLPFYPAVQCGRTLLVRADATGKDLWLPLLTTVAYAAVLALAAVLVFKYKTRREAE